MQKSRMKGSKSSIVPSIAKALSTNRFSKLYRACAKPHVAETWAAHTCLIRCSKPTLEQEQAASFQLPLKGI